MKDCNSCPYMTIESLPDVTDNAFKVTCGIFFIKTSEHIKQRTVSFRSYKGLACTPPEWCPLKPENRDKPKVYDITKLFENTNLEGERKVADGETAEKKDEIEIPRRTEWDSLEVGEDYVIPRIGTKPCKVVRISEKKLSFIKVKEVLANGSENSVSNTLFKDDVEAKLMSRRRSF